MKQYLINGKNYTRLEKIVTKSDKCSEIIVRAKKNILRKSVKTLAIPKEHLKSTDKY